MQIKSRIKILKKVIYDYKLANTELIEKNKQLEQKCDTLISQLDFAVQQKECLEQECKELKIELEELREWEQANKPTGICETCTEKSVQKVDFYRKASNEIEEIANTECGYCSKLKCPIMGNILNIINKGKEY